MGLPVNCHVQHMIHEGFTNALYMKWSPSRMIVVSVDLH